MSKKIRHLWLIEVRNYKGVWIPSNLCSDWVFMTKREAEAERCRVLREWDVRPGGLRVVKWVRAVKK